MCIGGPRSSHLYHNEDSADPRLWAGTDNTGDIEYSMTKRNNRERRDKQRVRVTWRLRGRVIEPTMESTLNFISRTNDEQPWQRGKRRDVNVFTYSLMLLVQLVRVFRHIFYEFGDPLGHLQVQTG